MKIQKLNNTQKKQLLEMCEDFLPDYKLKTQSLDSSGLLWVDTTWYNGQGNNIKHSEGYWVHWFQLCLTELPKAIYKKVSRYEFKGIYSPLRELLESPNFTYRDIVEAIIITDEHPVKFLYNFTQECAKKS